MTIYLISDNIKLIKAFSWNNIIKSKLLICFLKQVNFFSMQNFNTNFDSNIAFIWKVRDCYSFQCYIVIKLYFHYHLRTSKNEKSIVSMIFESDTDFKEQDSSKDFQEVNGNSKRYLVFLKKFIVGIF